jgi:hypothetical protein
VSEDNTEWVKTWVKHYNQDNREGLSEKEVRRAAVIGNAAFHGNVGVGDAARAGIEAVKDLRGE